MRANGAFSYTPAIDFRIFAGARIRKFLAKVGKELRRASAETDSALCEGSEFLQTSEE